jgi:hypothetical protein
MDLLDRWESHHKIQEIGLTHIEGSIFANLYRNSLSISAFFNVFKINVSSFVFLKSKTVSASASCPKSPHLGI